MRRIDMSKLPVVAGDLLGANLFFIYLKFHRLVLRLFAARFWPCKEQILKEFVRCDHFNRDWFIAQVSIPFFDGLHPKNIFGARHEFFVRNVHPDDVVLDIACGSGLILNKIAPFIKAGLGLDISTENLKICERMHKLPNLEFIHGNLLEFDYQSVVVSRGINVAVLSHILEHIEHPVDLLRRVGVRKLLICVPSQENWYTKLKIHLDLPYFRDPTHFREYTSEMLSAELRAAGYGVSEIGYNQEGEIICSAVLDDAPHRSN